MMKKTFLYGPVLVMFAWLIVFGPSAYLSGFSMAFAFLWLHLNTDGQMTSRPTGRILYILFPFVLFMGMSADLNLSSMYEICWFMFSAFIGGLFAILAKHFYSRGSALTASQSE
jgi:hypothetical protein